MIASMGDNNFEEEGDAQPCEQTTNIYLMAVDDPE